MVSFLLGVITGAVITLAVITIRNIILKKNGVKFEEPK